MGKSYTFQCKKGKYKLYANLGVGMSFPRVFAKIMCKARNGEFGEVPQKFLLENPNGVLDVSNVLAKCVQCGQYDIVPDLTMYLPKNPCHNKDFPMTWELREHYKIFAEYQHKCKQCGGNVEIFKETDFETWKCKITCPYCQGQMGVAKGVWD